MAYKYLNYDGVAYLWEKIKNALSGKVDKETGKGLSSNDYTSTEKTKLANIASGAQVNVLEGVQVNGSSLTPTNKIVNVTVPTKTSDITNDSGFITIDDVPEGAAASSTTPKMDGTAAVGTETAFARGDHRHPTDTSRAPLASPTFTGTPKAPTAAAGTDDTQIATTEFVQNAIDALDTGVSDVKIGTTSIVTNGVATIPNASTSSAGLMTSAEKTKLANIAAGAEVNVQSDWEATSGDALILNKPSIPSKTSDLTNDSDFVSDASYVHTDSNFTAEEKTKLAGITAGATVDDHKWNDVALSKTVSEQVVGKYGGGKALIPFLANTTSTSATLGEATITPGAYQIAVFNQDSRLSSTTPTSGDNSTLVATTAFVNTAISGKINSSEKGAASGVAPLNASSKIDAQYLPSYVDDVIEAYPRSGATELSSSWLSTSSGGSALTPETGKIYVLMAASTSYAVNSQFRWSGTTYVLITDGAGFSPITNAEIDTITA